MTYFGGCTWLFRPLSSLKRLAVLAARCKTVHTARALSAQHLLIRHPEAPGLASRAQTLKRTVSGTGHFLSNLALTHQPFQMVFMGFGSIWVTTSQIDGICLATSRASASGQSARPFSRCHGPLPERGGASRGSTRPTEGGRLRSKLFDDDLVISRLKFQKSIASRWRGKKTKKMLFSIKWLGVSCKFSH